MPVEVSELHELLVANFVLGQLRWKPRSVLYFYDTERFSAQSHANMWNGRFAGEKAFTSKDSHGYFQGDLLGKKYLAHRVLWAMKHGRWPTGMIDHANGVVYDNRVVNLREVTRLQNGQARSDSSKNSSGHRGVSWDNSKNKWVARITLAGKTYNLGCFVALEGAVNRRKEAEMDLDFMARDAVSY